MPVYVDAKQAAMRQYYRHAYAFQRLPTNQKFLIILVPAFFLLGIFLFFRSHPSSNVITASDRPIRVDFYVMSKCPDARKCELLFIPSLLKLAPIVNFTVSYIAYGNSPKDIQCLHGDEECQGNKQQLCVQHFSSQQTILKFLQCQSQDVDTIPTSGETCFKQVADPTSKWSDIDTCSNSQKGADLLYLSMEKSRSVSAKKSCTIHLNGKFWCMHDGRWYGCTEGRDAESFIKAICSRYNGPNRPNECPTNST